MKKFLGIFFIFLFVSVDAYALLGGPTSTSVYIYVSNKDSKSPYVRLQIAERHCSKFKKNTFHFKNDWYKGNPLPTGFRKKNFRFICALNDSIAREIILNFIATKKPKKKYNKKIGKQKIIKVELRSVNFETRTTEQIAKDEELERIRIEEERLAAIAAINEKKNKETNVGITDKTTLVKINKQIVKAELFPEIDHKEEIKFINLDKINESKLDELLNQNPEIYFVAPVNYVATSNITTKIKKQSQMQIGETLVPNPKLASLKTEINNGLGQRQTAFSKLQMAEATNDYNLSMDCGVSIICNLNKLADVKLLADAQRAYKSINAKLDRLIAQLANTPAEIARPRYQSYEYVELNVSAEKKVIFKIIKSINGNFEEKEIFIEESKNFTIGEGINGKDKNYDSLKNKYASAKKVGSWQNMKFSSIGYIDFFDKITNEGSFKKIKNKNSIISKLKETRIAKIKTNDSNKSSVKSKKSGAKKLIEKIFGN